MNLYLSENILYDLHLNAYYFGVDSDSFQEDSKRAPFRTSLMNRDFQPVFYSDEKNTIQLPNPAIPSQDIPGEKKMADCFRIWAGGCQIFSALAVSSGVAFSILTAVALKSMTIALSILLVGVYAGYELCKVANNLLDFENKLPTLMGEVLSTTHQGEKVIFCGGEITPYTSFYRDTFFMHYLAPLDKKIENLFISRRSKSGTLAHAAQGLENALGAMKNLSRVIENTPGIPV